MTSMFCAASMMLASGVLLPSESAAEDSLHGWTSISIGVRDLDDALELWVDTFGFEVLRTASGADAELARFWGLSPDDIRRQALVRSDASGYGMIHFVEYRNPGPSVRGGAEVFDFLPKNLDIFVDDLPLRFEQLKLAGIKFHSETYGEMTAPDGTAFREIHIPSHDDLNVVLLEVIGQSGQFTEHGFAGIGPLIFVVPDAAKEKAFIENVMQLDKISDNLLVGREIEKVVGLPPGSALDVSVWGRHDVRLGGLEVIEYQGVAGANRYPLARPGATGALHVSYIVRDASALLARARLAGTAVSDLGSGTTLIASGHLYRFATPAGLAVEVYEVPDTDQ